MEAAKAIQDKLREDYLNYFSNPEERETGKGEEKEEVEEDASESEVSKEDKRESDENGSRKNDN